MVYFACLISGPQNGIIVYNLRDHKREIFSQIWFTDGNATTLETQNSQHNVREANLTIKHQKTSVQNVTQAKKINVNQPQIVTRICFTSNMSEISVIGPNGLFTYYKIHSPDFSKIVDEEQIFIKQFRQFLDPTCVVTGLSWNELYDKEKHSVYPTDGKILAICSDQGHLCAAYNECPDDQQPILWMQKYQQRSFCDVAVIQRAMIAATFNCEFFFFQLSNEQNPQSFIELRKWSLFESVSTEFIPSPNVVVRGMRTIFNKILGPQMAVQLSNQNVMLINLHTQVFSEDKKEDLQAKIEEHDLLKKSRLSPETLRQLSTQEQKKKKDDLEQERKQIMDIKIQYLNNGFHSGAISELHTCLQRSVILTCSLEDNTVRLWNYMTNNCDFKMDFKIKQGDSIIKPLKCCALHPSGYYMAVAVNESLTLYHILHNESRVFHTYDIKNIQMLRFSSGGQYLWAVDSKNMYVYSTYTLERIKLIPCLSNHISCISFDDLDSQLTFLSRDGFFQRYSQIQFSKEGDQDLVKSNEYTGCVYLPEKKEILEKSSENHDQLTDRIIVVGKDSLMGAAFLNIFDGKNDKFDKNPVVFKGEEYDGVQGITEMYRINDVCLVTTPKHLIKNLVFTTNRGTLRVINLPEKRNASIKEERFMRPEFIHQTLYLHSCEASRVASTMDGRYVFSIGLDGILFVLKVKEHKIDLSQSQGYVHVEKLSDKKKQKQKQVNQETNHIAVAQTIDKDLIGKGIVTIPNEDQLRIDTELADIVLVSKSKMEKWRKEQEKLKDDMEEQSNKVETSLRSRRYSFEQRRAQMEKEMTERLSVLNKEYSNLQMEEAEQKDNNTQQMKNMEITHNKCKEELQELYEKKLEYERQQFILLKMEQEEMRKIKEQEIRMFNLQQEQDIEQLLEKFKTSLQNVQDNYEKSKRYGDSLKMKNEEKLTSQEQDQTEEIEEIRKQQKEEIVKLDDVIAKLKNDLVGLRWQTVQSENEEKQYNAITRNLQEIMKQLIKKEGEQKKKQDSLNAEKSEVHKNLKKKETELYRQKFKIKDLQKTKEVLTHLTQEVKASLEPREQQIEALKQQLVDYEKTFSIQSTEIQNQTKNSAQKVEYIKKLKSEIVNEKLKTKKQDKKISDFVSQINKIVQEKDDNASITGLMNIYKNNVKYFADEILDKKKKDPETIDELDRQLKYMEKSINQLKQTTQKNQSKSKQNINKRTEENTGLIRDLGELRIRDQERKDIQDDLEKEINEKNNTKRRVETEIKQIQDQIKKAKQHKETAITSQPSQLFQRPKTGAQLESDAFRRTQSRGKLIKGPLFNNRPTGIYKQKISELMAQLEENNQTILLQNLHIATLKDDFFAAVREHQDIQSQQQNQFAQMQQELDSMNMADGENPSYIQQLDKAQK